VIVTTNFWITLGESAANTATCRKNVNNNIDDRAIEDPQIGGGI
jgi:hypothetical protein